MSKKQAPKTTRKKKEKISPVLTSVTSKTQDAQLKKALDRFKKRQTKTDLFDHALPVSTLFAGIVRSKQRQPLKIQSSGDQTLSPYILALKEQLPSPQQLLEEGFKPVRLNLLNGNVSPTRVREEEFFSTQHDLTLQAEELQQQVLPERTKEVLQPVASITSPETSWNAIVLEAQERGLAEVSQHFQPLSVDGFVPTAPEDVMSYFDFPEDEEEELESEVVTLEELGEESIEQEQEVIQEPTPGFSWSFDWLLPAPVIRGFVSFVLLSFVVVLPLHAMNFVQDLQQTKVELTTAGQSAVSLLSDGAQAALARDGAGAGSSFELAGEQFNAAAQSIDALGIGTNVLLGSLPAVGSDFRSGKALIEAGEALSIAGARVAAGLEAMNTELNPTPVSRLAILEMYLSSALPHLQSAKNAFNSVDPEDLPAEYQSTFSELTNQLPAIEQTIQEFLEFHELAHIILGGEGTQRYLLIFQNNTEIRPTGGFIGSFAELKVHDGVIEELTVPGGGSYDLQGSLKTNIAAPEPLRLLSAKWEFQDGNWFPDFPTSARQLLQFYRDAGGPSVDGVIAINATYVSELIGLLGAVYMPEYGRTIDEENFIFEAQRIVEIEYDREENKPKAFIGDLAPILMERALEKTSSDFLELLSFADQGLRTKDVQVYFSNDDLQREVLEQGWGGAIEHNDSDFLMVVDTNLGGGKTDGVIEQDVQLDVEVGRDGSIVNTVTISRTHHGIQGLLFTGVNNVNYMRVYVPKGSQLISAQGFSIPDKALFDEPNATAQIDDDLHYISLTQEADPVSGTHITQEHGKTVFGNWVQTKPGTTSTVTFTYRLPDRLNVIEPQEGVWDTLQEFIGIPQTNTYSLMLQKQPGILDRETRVSITLPETLSHVWKSHADNHLFTNETDNLYSILLEH